jgi:hypothetical protein
MLKLVTNPDGSWNMVEVETTITETTAFLGGRKGPVLNGHTLTQVEQRCTACTTAGHTVHLNRIDGGDERLTCEIHGWEVQA